MSLKTQEKLSPEAYLAWEHDNDTRHEYIDGEVFAMVGARDAHVTVSGNIFALLRNHVRGGSCRVYMADMKLGVAADNAFYYPDVMVCCDERDRAQEYVKSHPTLIIEVLSSSTSAFDRGRKFASYRRIESLREYVIIDPDTYSVDCFRRDESGHWVLYPYTENDVVDLACLSFSASMADIYEDVRFND